MQKAAAESSAPAGLRTQDLRIRRFFRLPGSNRPQVLTIALPDSSGAQDVTAVRPIRDEIERRVSTLLDELSVPAAS
jgi:hypothetical protein